MDLGELITVSVEGPDFDPSHPCAHSGGPTEDSTVGPDGTFTASDETGRQSTGGVSPARGIS